MGPQAVQNPAALMAALKAQQPPSNPATPFERLNPDQQALEHVKAAAVSLERATQFTNDMPMQMTFNAIIGTLNKALLKFDGQQVMNGLRESVQTFPPIGAPGPVGQQAPGQTPAPAGPGLPAAPQAAGPPAA
jgi:hypothetical protein